MGRASSMKIVVKLERAGEVVAKTEFEAGDSKDILKKAGQAFKAFRREHPNVSLLEEDVCLRFGKAE
jgi:hypothetical protein